jgi:hypothetical protein
MFLMTIFDTWYGNVQIGKYDDSTYAFDPVYNETTYVIDSYSGNSSTCVNVTTKELKNHPAFEKLLKAEACRTPLNENGITTCEISQEEWEDISKFYYSVDPNAPGSCLRFENYEGVYTFFFNRP